MSVNVNFFTVMNTFPRSQRFDITPTLNETMFKAIKYYIEKELQQEIGEHQQRGVNYLVTKNLVVEVPYIMDGDLGAVPFMVHIGGMGGEGKRDEIRRQLQCLLINTLAEAEL